MPGGGEPRSRHEKRPAPAAAPPRGEPHRRPLATARCPQSGGGSAEPPLSTAGAPSARIDPHTATAARGPGVLPVARGQVVRPRSRSRVGLRRRDARRRRYLGPVRAVGVAPAGPAPPAPRGAGPDHAFDLLPRTVDSTAARGGRGITRLREGVRHVPSDMRTLRGQPPNPSRGGAPAEPAPARDLSLGQPTRTGP
jgi:hypothetical protein